MEYTTAEKQALDMMKRINFKNLSKNDVLNIASKLSELRPDVAKEVITQFPEFVKLVQLSIEEYKDIFGKIILSDEESLKQVYATVNKDMDISSNSRKQFYAFVKQVQADCSKLLDNPNLPPEMMIEILNREAELVKMANEKDTEIRQQEKEIEDKVNKKDSEKREFNWKLVGGISFALMTVAGISAGVLGGKFDLKFPKKS